MSYPNRLILPINSPDLLNPLEQIYAQVGTEEWLVDNPYGVLAHSVPHDTHGSFAFGWDRTVTSTSVAPDKPFDQGKVWLKVQIPRADLAAEQFLAAGPDGIDKSFVRLNAHDEREVARGVRLERIQDWRLTPILLDHNLAFNVSSEDYVIRTTEDGSSQISSTQHRLRNVEVADTTDLHQRLAWAVGTFLKMTDGKDD